MGGIFMMLWFYVAFMLFWYPYITAGLYRWKKKVLITIAFGVYLGNGLFWGKGTVQFMCFAVFWGLVSEFLMLVFLQILLNCSTYEPLGRTLWSLSPRLRTHVTIDSIIRPTPKPARLHYQTIDDHWLLADNKKYSTIWNPSIGVSCVVKTEPHVLGWCWHDSAFPNPHTLPIYKGFVGTSAIVDLEGFAADRRSVL